MERTETILMLCDIRSAHNVGAIFRTADAVGVSKIILGGITPAPVDRFGRVRKDITKASLGAEQSIPWFQCTNVLSEVKKMKKLGYFVVSIEQSVRSLDYKKIKIPDKNILFVVGSEVDGISKQILAESDIIAEIPIQGKKESLNVSVATGVALFRILNV